MSKQLQALTNLSPTRVTLLFLYFSFTYHTMSYAKQDGKDTVLFVDKDYVEQQPEIEVPKSDDQESKQDNNDQAAAFDPETGEINWDCPCKSFLTR